jgi:hypothetical protein
VWRQAFQTERTAGNEKKDAEAYLFLKKKSTSVFIWSNDVNLEE